mgnify:FL=1
MSKQDKPLTAKSSIGTWLEHPLGGPALRELLEAGGQDASALKAVRLFSLQRVASLSQGQFSQDMIDALVLKANGGTAPVVSDDEDDDAQEWAAQTSGARFSGKTVIVTGAGSGIGRATAQRIAAEGGRVIAVDIAADRLDELAANCPEGSIVAVGGDITKQDDIDRIIAAAGERIDGLANIAGINDDFSPAHETSDATWDRVIGINLTGTFKLTRAALPAMIDAARGSIVNVASEAGLRGNASGNAYTVSKHGVVGLTRSAAFMYGPQGIRVNAVAPGGVMTGIPMPANVSVAGRERLTPFQAMIPSIATAEQLAASITFLLSDDGVNINGVVLPSDGGWSVQ